MEIPVFPTGSQPASFPLITAKDSGRHAVSGRRKFQLKILVGLFSIVCLSLTVPRLRAGGQAEKGAASAQEPVASSLLSQADQVLQQMSDLTGLPIRGSLKKQIVSRSEIQKLLTENIHREYTPRELHVQEATFKAFGLISKDFNFEKFLLSFYTEQAAGFYDPHTKTMYLADWIPADLQVMALAHELTHALQDQNFNLDHFMRAARTNDDAEAARQAVVEGYATAAMFQQALGSTALPALPSFDEIVAPLIHKQMNEFPVFSKAPFFLRMQALFPYIQGTSFIEKGLKRGGWKELDSLFTSPPSSTKAIFQPSVYFDHASLPQAKLPVKSPLDSAPGFVKLDENTMGELGIYAMLGQLLSEDKAKAISPQWFADRYIVYENPARQSYALVARARWEDSQSALMFFREYHTLLAQKYPELAPDSHSTAERFIGRTAEGEVILLHAGNEVRWAEGVPADKVDEMVQWLGALDH